MQALGCTVQQEKGVVYYKGKLSDGKDNDSRMKAGKQSGNQNQQTQRKDCQLKIEI